MEADIKELATLDTQALASVWRQKLKSSPPRRSSREYLLGHLAWQVQAEKHGGLSRAASRQLNRLMQQVQGGIDLTPDTSLIIKPGTKLLREYQGVKHEVIVAETGFQYNQTIYASLSAIAREITGTRWNGKLFFGIKR